MLFLVKNKNLFILVLVSFLLHLAFLPFSQTIDADAVSRSFIAARWLDHPKFFANGVWPPLLHYLNVIFLFISGSDVWGPKILNLIFVVGTIIPMYNFIKREFNEEGAILGILIYQCSPVVFNVSLQALSAIPFIFFMALGLNELSKSIRNEHYRKPALLAGIFFTIACGIRYEGWILISIYTLVVMLFKKWKVLLYFFPVALIFPVFWMLGNYIEYGDMFYGLTWSNSWNLVIEGTNDQLTMKNMHLRMLFFPITLFFQLNPVISLIIIIAVGYLFYKQKMSVNHINWLLPFLTIFCFYIYNTMIGTQLMHSRYAVNLVFLLSPYISLIFDFSINRKLINRLLTIIVIVHIPLSFYFNYQVAGKSFKVEPIPRLPDPEISNIEHIIKPLSNKDKGLIIDFLGWEESFYLALRAKGYHMENGNICIINGAANSNINFGDVRTILNRYNKGIIIVKKGSRFNRGLIENKPILYFKDIPDIYLEINSIYKSELYEVYTYKRKSLNRGKVYLRETKGYFLELFK